MFSFVILNETLVTAWLTGCSVSCSWTSWWWMLPKRRGTWSRSTPPSNKRCEHTQNLVLFIYLFCSLNFVQKCLQHLLTKITFNPQNTIISCTNVNEKHEWQVKASRLILRVTYVQIWTFGGNVSKHFEVEPCDRAVTLTSCPLQL